MEIFKDSCWIAHIGWDEFIRLVRTRRGLCRSNKMKELNGLFFLQPAAALPRFLAVSYALEKWSAVNNSADFC